MLFLKCKRLSETCKFRCFSLLLSMLDLPRMFFKFFGFLYFGKLIRADIKVVYILLSNYVYVRYFVLVIKSS